MTDPARARGRAPGERSSEARAVTCAFATRLRHALRGRAVRWRVDADLHEVTDRLAHVGVRLDVLGRQLLGRAEGGDGLPDSAALGQVAPGARMGP